jgi:pimeloyl-ACP methyl ester carboxylesterase
MLGGCGKKTETVAHQQRIEQTDAFAGPRQPENWRTKCGKNESGYIPEKPGPGAYKGRLLIFIHGIWGDPICSWQRDGAESLFTYLRQDPRIGDNFDMYTFGYPANVWDAGAFGVVEAAIKLRETFESEEFTKRYGSIVLIAHSMGGLVALEYLTTFQDSRANVPLLITLATPYSGSEVADLVKLVVRNPAIRDLVTPGAGNSLVRSLHNRAGYVFYQEPSTQIACAYEKSAVAGAVNVVAQESATALCRGAVPIPEDHLGVPAPTGPTHATVNFIVTRLVKLIDANAGMTAKYRRETDYSDSTCENGVRKFRAVLTDTVTFSTERTGRIPLRMCKYPDVDVSVEDLNGAGGPLVGFLAPKTTEACAKRDGRTVEFPGGAIVRDRQARFKWTWTKAKDELAGARVDGTLPLTVVELIFRLPPGVDFGLAEVDRPEIECVPSDGLPDGSKRLLCRRRDSGVINERFELKFLDLKGVACSP